MTVILYIAVILYIIAAIGGVAIGVGLMLAYIMWTFSKGRP